jgi:hypothetical protein
MNKPMKAKEVLQGLLGVGYDNEKTVAYIQRLIRSVNENQPINDQQMVELVATLNDVDYEFKLAPLFRLPIGHHLIVANWLNRLEP